MKKLIIIAIAALSIVSCKNNENTNGETVDENLVTTANSNLAVYKGEFIYTADAAVLKGKDFIYGVTLDEKMQELADKVAPIKKEEFDMVAVVVTGTLADKAAGTEGWEEVLTIVDIVQVSKTPMPADVKIEDKKGKGDKARKIQKK